MSQKEVSWKFSVGHERVKVTSEWQLKTWAVKDTNNTEWELTQERNQKFQRAEVGWQYQGTVGVILINSGELDLRGFGKWTLKAVTKRALIRFLTKRAGVATPTPPV